MEYLMDKYTFIDRYFHSQFELVDIRCSEERDINTLFSFLENLHATADKLKDQFDCNIKSIPEFKLLRMIRNYFHHVGDVDEYRVFVTLDNDAQLCHTEHIIIPLELFAKSLKSFIDKNTVAESDKQYRRKMDFVSSEIASIIQCCDCQDMIRKLSAFCESPRLKLDGVIFSLGFDLFRFVYNITNTIADKCKNIEELNTKELIKGLDFSYSTMNNIEVRDLMCRPGYVPILTTKGFVFATKIESVI